MWSESRLYKLISVLLVAILSLTFIVAPKREAEAAFPFVLTPALYYAIATSLILAGAYAVTTDGFEAIVQDFYEESSESVKSAYRNAAQGPVGQGYYATAEMIAAAAAFITSLFLGEKTELSMLKELTPFVITRTGTGPQSGTVYMGAFATGEVNFKLAFTTQGDDGTFWYEDNDARIWAGDNVNGTRYVVRTALKVWTTTGVINIGSVFISRTNFSNGVAGSSVTLYSASSLPIGLVRSFYDVSQTSNGTTTTTKFGQSAIIDSITGPETADRYLGKQYDSLNGGYSQANQSLTHTAYPFIRQTVPVGGNVGVIQEIMDDPQWDATGKKVLPPPSWTVNNYIGADAHDFPLDPPVISEPGEGIWDQAWDSILGVLESIYTGVLAIPGPIVAAVNNVYTSVVAIPGPIVAAVTNVYNAITALPASIATAISDVFVPAVPLSTYWSAIYSAAEVKFPFSLATGWAGVFSGAGSSGYPTWDFQLMEGQVLSLNWADYSNIFDWSKTFLTVILWVGGLFAILKMTGWRGGGEDDN